MVAWGRHRQNEIVTVLVVVVGLVGAASEARPVVGAAVALAVGAVFAPRRRWPVLSLAGTQVIAVVVTVLHAAPSNTPGFTVAATVGLYTVGVSVPPRRAAVGLGFTLAAWWACVSVGTASPGDYLAAALVVGASWAIGVFVGRERTLRASAERLAVALEGQRQAAAAAAVAEERQRIAREMHDVVAHGLSAISVQSSAAEAALAVDPVRAWDPVRTIGDLSRSCVEEVRQILHVLRSDDGGSEPGGTGSLDVLMAAQRSLGLDVTATIDHALLLGEPEGTRHAVLRVVQEGLTNVRRHSHAGSATVQVREAGGHLEVAIVDPGPQRPDHGSGPGHGTLGISERIAALGGTCVIGPVGPGWSVIARLPLAREVVP